MTDENSTPSTDAETDERYGLIVTGGGETLIYDREQSDAWLQSDHAVDISPAA